MANNWDIPDWLEKKVRLRDELCVYCRVKLKWYPHIKGTPGDKATWEHIDNDGDPIEENIVLCCSACNSSKGVKKLLYWLNSSYCMKKNINKKTVAPVIQKYIEINK